MTDTPIDKDKTAIDIYQRFLDTADAALLSGDAEGFLALIELPHVLSTESEIIVIADRAEAERHFAGFHGSLKAQGVNGYTRVARAAHFVGEDTIEGRHETFITSDGKLVVPAFLNEITLAHRDGAWKSLRTRHHAKYVSWPDLLPRGRS